MKRIGTLAMVAEPHLHLLLLFLLGLQLFLKQGDAFSG